MPLITRWPCFTEAMYLALHRGGWAMQNQLGSLVTNDMLTFHEIQGERIGFYCHKSVQWTVYHRAIALYPGC
jgi:hypothetical protein